MKSSFLMKPLLWLAGLLVRLNFATCRKRYSERSQNYGPHLRDMLGVTWHRGAIFALYLFASHKPAVLVSRSKDGELLATFIKQLGAIPVRGSSSRGGVAALTTILRMLKSGQALSAATVADGPRGPRYQAKEGMIILAMKSGLPLLPLMWSCDRAWVFKNAWDKTMVPKPFAKVWIELGPLLRYPASMSKEELEEARLHLQQTLEEMRLRLDALAGYQEP